MWLERHYHGAARAGEQAATPATAYEPSRRLPDHLLENALCLQMEDHHVRIHAHHRSWLQLATMREAIDQIDPTRGLQVHRSWWVARAAVRDVVEEGRTVRLRLANGIEVPVARSRIAALRSEGWLPPASEPPSGQEIAG